jgi:hypothetical protein
MSVSATFISALTITEPSAETLVQSTDNTISYVGPNQSLTLTGLTSPAVSKQAAFEVTMSGGAATIDMQALVGALGSIVDGTGLKVQMIKFTNKATNANAITIAEGASNGYELLGGSFTFTLPVGGSALFYLPEGSPDIAANASEIDISGTGSQVLQVAIAMG